MKAQLKNMDKHLIFSGEELVARGTTKLETTLPAIGLKDVTPNGSWLEQKQIQAALEERKHLIEVERIEKCGNLSHAEWCDDLNLAEVTQNTGSYWQYLGHHRDKKLYLNPEEALFLMETNCLQLKHNEVTVSLQKAYSLLLNKNVSLLQYKVYSALSRLGYRVYRHEVTNLKQSAKNLHKIEAIESDIDMKSVDCTVEEPILNSIDHDAEKSALSEETTQPIIDNEKSTHICDASHTLAVEISEDKVKSNENCTNNNTKSNYVNEITDRPTGNITLQETESIENVNIKECEETMQITSEITKLDKDIDSSTLGKPNEGCTDINSKATNIFDITEENESDDTELRKDLQQNNELNIQEKVIHIDQNSETASVMEIDSQDDDTIVDENISNQAAKANDQNDNSVIKTANIECDGQSYTSDNVIVNKLQKLQNRQTRPCNFDTLKKQFENFPDLYKKCIVTIQAPQESHIPKNIFLNHPAYVLNIDNIRIKKVKTDSETYTLSDEVNDVHIRRVRSASACETPQNNPTINFSRFRAHASQQFRPNFWRQRPLFGYNNFNMFFPRYFMGNNYNPFRFQFYPRTYPYFNLRQFTNSNINPNARSTRKRTIGNEKRQHFESIKKLALRLKHLVLSGNTQTQNIQALERLIHTYNTRYKTRVRLTNQFDVVVEENIVDTIDLDDDEGSKSKKSRLEDNNETFETKLNKFKQLATKLKYLELERITSSRHRRAFSNAIKTFNKYYKADIYMNSNYEIIDRRQITIDTSSDSDCVIEDNPVVPPKGKKFKNPFNILKRLSKKFVVDSTKEKECVSNENATPGKYNERILQIFNENWLPKSDDFGRAEVLPGHLMNARLIETYREQYLFDFLKNKPDEFSSWVDVKLSFFKYLKKTALTQHFQGQTNINDGVELNSLIGSEDCKDMPSILRKLSIIKTNKDMGCGNSLRIDFDVYNRNVQNFKKSMKPLPNFRVICIEETSLNPSGAEILTLHSTVEDKVPIVFAIVSVGSISYIQLIPSDLPMYIPSNDL